MDIGSNEQAMEAYSTALRENERAMEEHTVALRAVKAEMRRTNDLARQYGSRDEFQHKKFIADLLSGQFGKGIVVRRPRFNWYERLAGRLIAMYAAWRSF